MQVSIIRLFGGILAGFLAAPFGEAAQPPGAPESEPTAVQAGAKRSEPRHSDDDIPFGDRRVPKGRRVQKVVSIFGSTEVKGEVVRDAVSVLGNTSIDSGARVGGGVVSVLGGIESEGEIGDKVVCVLGDVSINGPVGGKVVVVLGDLELGPNAVLGGDVTVIGGETKRDPGAIIRGKEVRVPFVGSFSHLEGFMSWVTRCVFLGRPLGFGPNLEWAWLVAFSFLLFYFVLALLFERSIIECAATLETRPGATIVASVLTVLLTPMVIVLLALTLVGAFLIPFFGAGLFFANLFGKAVLLAWIGGRITRFFDEGPARHPAFGVLIGGLIVMLLYTIPFAGFLIYKLLSWLGLGVVVYTIVLYVNRQKPRAAASVNAVSAAARLPNPVPVAAGDPSTAQPPPIPPQDTPLPAPGFSPPPLVPASTLPRASFFLRMGALLLDLILVGIIVKFLPDFLPRFMQFNSGFGSGMLAVAIYGAIMWKTKGTTIGGIVCGLKVVRTDNRELDWATAWVRALACFLSFFAVGLGFIWIAIDDEKQAWHDKIAGTAVVRVPKGESLV